MSALYHLSRAHVMLTFADISLTKLLGHVSRSFMAAVVAMEIILKPKNNVQLNVNQVN